MLDILKNENITLKHQIYAQKLEISLLKLQISLIPHIQTHKSVVVYSNEAKRLLFEFILENKHITVRNILKFLNLSPTTYYSWLKYTPKSSRGPSLLKLTKEEKQLLIDTKKENMKLGHKKVCGLARNKDLWLSNSSSYNILKEVKMLMKYKLKESPLTKSKYEPYRKLMIIESDWTAYKVGKELYQILVCIDLYSRYVLYWKCLKTVSSIDISEMLIEIYKNHLLKYSLFPTHIRFDCGPANIASVVKDLCLDIGLTFDPGRPYRPTDQAYIERFFRSLKQELIYNSKFKSYDESVKFIGDWVLYYNNVRPHESLFNFTPYSIHYSFISKSEAYALYCNKLNLGRLGRILSNKEC